MNCKLLWDATQHRLAVSYRRFRTTCRSIFKGHTVQSSWTALPLKIGRIVFPEMSVNTTLLCQTSQKSEDLIIQSDNGAKRFLRNEGNIYQTTRLQFQRL